MRNPNYIDIGMEDIPGMRELVQTLIMPCVEGFSPKHLGNVAFVMRIILSNMYLKWCQGRTMTFSLDDKAYRRNKVWFATARIFVTHIPRCFRELERLGVIRIVKGTGVGRPSQALPTDWLIENIFLAMRFPVSLPDKDLFILRGPKKPGQKSSGPRMFVNSRDSFPAENIRFLQKWNAHVGRSVVTASLVRRDDNALDALIKAHVRGRITSDITCPENMYAQLRAKPDGWRFRLADLALYRVFNERLDRGGRFYGSIHMELPKEFRTSFAIDGEKAVELDFSGLHVRMLYHRKGIDYVRDPYDLGGYPRSIFKQPFLMMVNTKSEMSARRAIYNHLRTDRNRYGREYLKKDKERVVWNFSQTLLDTFKQNHPQISGDFFTGVGLDLQFQDSEIMKSILERLLQLNIVALPIHDSIMCKASQQDTVRSIMVQEYERAMGYPPVIHVQ